MTPRAATVGPAATRKRGFDGIYPVIHFETGAGRITIAKIKKPGYTGRPNLPLPHRAILLLDGERYALPTTTETGFLARLDAALKDDLAGQIVRRIVGRSAVTWDVTPGRDIRLDGEGGLADTQAVALAIQELATLMRHEVNVPKLLDEARVHYATGPILDTRAMIGKGSGTERIVYDCMGRLADFGIVSLDLLLPTLGYSLIDVQDQEPYYDVVDYSQNPISISAEFQTVAQWVVPAYRAADPVVAAVGYCHDAFSATDADCSLPLLEFGCDRLIVSEGLGCIFAEGLRLEADGHEVARITTPFSASDGFPTSWRGFPPELRAPIDSAISRGIRLTALFPASEAAILSLIEHDDVLMIDVLHRAAKQQPVPVDVWRFIDRSPDSPLRGAQRLDVKALRVAMQEVFLTERAAPARAALATRLASAVHGANRLFIEQVAPHLQEARRLALAEDEVLRLETAFSEIALLAQSMTPSALLRSSAVGETPAL